jgi:ABC-2 type transport system permease protein
VFIKIFTSSEEGLPSFLFFLSLFVPIVGIALGFDVINSERSSGNLSRLLSQPIYRDAVINGKFLAGLAVLAMMVVAVLGVVSGLGLRIVGVPPSGEEVARLSVFALLTIVYGAFWMALASLFSVVFNRAATSMLASLGLWIFLFFFLPMIAGAVANASVPVDQSSSVEMLVRNAEIQSMISRVSPAVLYGEVISALLAPDNLTFLVIASLAGRMPNPLPLNESLLLVWPQVVTIVALSAICFAVSYLRFMREEVRSL